VTPRLPKPTGPEGAEPAPRRARRGREIAAEEAVTTSPPREVGRRVVASLRRTLADRLAEAWRSDPDRLAKAVELGIINPEWVEAPGDHQFSSAAPMEVVERFLEKTAEERPSMLASLGLTALQILGSTDEAEVREGSSSASSPLVIMFTDLEGFTSYTAAHGDEAASALLATHHRAVAPVVRGRGGQIVKRLGDGLLLTFRTAESAVLAGLDLTATAPAPLRLRAGAHLGDVMVSRDDVLGHVVNVAARVTDRAGGGEVLVTEAVREAAPDVEGVTFGRVRRLRLKGLDERVPVCRVEHQRPALLPS
jgi:adenylate cyclase